MPGMVITGWGAAQPSRVLTNADLEARLETSDSWIVERTGIRERRVGGSTTALAVEAGRRALARAGIRPELVGLLMVSTNTPDQPVPHTSALVQAALGTGGGALDITCGCSGFVYGLVLANGLVATGAGRILFIASDTVSRIVDPADRDTAILFGDAAAAVVIEPSANGGALLGWDLGVDGRAACHIRREHGGYVEMNGREVFRYAVRITPPSSRAALRRAGVSAEEVDLFIPHQANLRIIKAVVERLGIPMERTVVNVDRAGNTSSASIPLGLVEAAEAGRLHDGDLILMSGFGAGMAWGSGVLRWSEG